MAKRAKRATRPNPRVNRDLPDFQENIIELNHFKLPRDKRIEIIPRNLAQERYIEALYDDSKSAIFAVGPAGTGKTMLATLFAIAKYRDGTYSKIIITRPAVSTEEQHGFLPGNIIDKMYPWVIPILDVFKEVYSTKFLTKMIEEEIIEIAPLAYMRGRTLKNAICIFDEAQNATPGQMKMVLTRLGHGAKIIITGDLDQHDRGFEANGLKDFLEKLDFNPSAHITVCQFTLDHIERHPIIEDILRIYNN